jgi:hypothetical protein
MATTEVSRIARSSISACAFAHSTTAMLVWPRMDACRRVSVAPSVACTVVARVPRIATFSASALAPAYSAITLMYDVPGNDDRRRVRCAPSASDRMVPHRGRVEVV